jgi:hypothetical protein
MFHFLNNLNPMVLHPVARVSQKFVELHRTQLLYYTCKKSCLKMAWKMGRNMSYD